jgi:hypothetical protein
MDTFRREFHSQSGDSKKVYQKIYVKDGNVIVLDKGENPPEGYKEAREEDILEE